MATTSTAVATIEPVFTEPERLALAGFLAGYTDLTHEAYALDRNELGALLVAAGLGLPAEHALISLLALNGLRVSEATGANIEALGVERGHRTLVITRKGGKVVSIPLAPRTARAIDLAVGERSEGPVFLAADGRRLDRHGARPDRPPGRPPRWDQEADRATHATARVHHRSAVWTPGAAARRAGRRLPRRSSHHHEIRPCPRQPGPARDLHRRRLPRRCRPVCTYEPTAASSARPRLLSPQG
jgi:integrase